MRRKAVTFPDYVYDKQNTTLDRIGQFGKRANKMVRQIGHKLKVSPKGGQRSQYAALCYRVRRGKPEILLITSRGTHRWIVPKGWPIDDLTPAETAAQEAWEEAGVTGKSTGDALGIYTYDKILGDGGALPIAALIYPLKVSSLAKNYPESDERKRRWFTPKKAASRVDEPELARIIRDFDPKSLR